jgi:anionic cell wall polymer biosynthesis LytR-Cps2A-Psr (LCP) family protein
LKKRIILICTVAVIIILSLTGLYFYKVSTRNAVEQFIVGDIMINVLIAGSNIYNDNKHKLYSIISIQPGTKKIGLIFIPPNFRVTINERKKQYRRIDEVDISDFNLLSESLYRDTKLKIPFYIVLYSPDIERLVDLIGGLELYVLDQVKNIHGIKTGLNYFDGAKTLQYINSAEENSIYIKYDRIEDILLTLFSNKSKYKKLFNTEVISEVIKSIKTNLLAQEIATLAGLLYDDKTDLLCAILPGSFTDNGFYQLDNISYKLYEKEFLIKLLQDKQTEQSIKIKIINGTEVSGLAMKTRAFLIREGLNVIEFGTSPYPFQENTVVISQKGEIGPAKKVADLLSISKIYHIIDSTQLNNVLLIIGTDMAK